MVVSSTIFKNKYDIRHILKQDILFLSLICRHIRQRNRGLKEKSKIYKNDDLNINTK